MGQRPTMILTSTSTRPVWVSRIQWLSFLFVILLIVVPKVSQPFSFRTHAYDTGIYTNTVWNTAHGRWFHSDLIDIAPAPGQDRGGNHLGDHFSPILAALAPLAWIVPHQYLATVLCGVQGLAAAAALIIVYFLALDVVREKYFGADWLVPATAATATVFMLMMSRAFSGAVWFEFHPSTLGMPFLAGLLQALRRRSLVWACVCAIVVLSCKESAQLAIGGTAIYSLLELRRWRASAVLTLAAIAIALLAFTVVMPWARQGLPWDKARRFGPLAYLGLKGIYLLTILGGMAFLPLFSPRTLLAALPGIALNLAVNNRAQYKVLYHYDDLNSIFLALASAHGLANLLGWIEGRIAGKHGRRLAILLTAAATFGAVYFVRGSSGFAELYRTIARPGAVQVQSQMAGLFALPPDVGVVGQEAVLPHFAARNRVVLMRGDRSFAETRTITADPVMSPLHLGDIIVLTPDAGAGLPTEPKGQDLINWAMANTNLRPRQITPPIYVFEVISTAPPKAP